MDSVVQNVRCVLKMLSSKELEKMGKAIEEIGSAKTCITGPILKDTKKIVLEKD